MFRSLISCFHIFRTWEFFKDFGKKGERRKIKGFTAKSESDGVHENLELTETTINGQIFLPPAISTFHL